jgi:hypothetical protein
MLSVEQVRALEGRVEKALAYISSLRTENADLRARLGKAEGDLGLAAARAAELEAAAESFRRDQARIEEGIVHALEKLDAFEDLVIRAAEPSPREAPAADRRPAPAAQQAAVPSAPAREAAPASAAPQAAAPAAPPLREAAPAPAVPEAAAPAPALDADELSLEELEAATAPDAPAARAPAAQPAPANELDIF